MQGKPYTSDTGLWIVRNVTRSDTGTYKCEAMDFDALEADLVKTLTFNVHRESLERQKLKYL